MAVAFTFARQSDVAASNPLSLYSRVAEVGDNWNKQTSTFTSPGNLILFVELCGGVRDSGSMALTLDSGYPDLGVSRRGTGAGYSMSCRPGIMAISTDSELSVKAAGSGTDSDAFWGTSFSAFSVTDTMVDEELSNFFVGRRTEITTTGRIKFLNYFTLPTQNSFVIRNSGDYFRCPRTGLYYFGYSIGVDGGNQARVAIMRKSTGDTVQIAELTVTNTALEGVNTFSKELLMPCSSGDEVWLDLVQGRIYSSIAYHASWTGFEYLPHHDTPVAWSISASTGAFASGAETAVNFDNILVTQPSEIFSDSEDQILIPYTGYYYLYVSGAATGIDELDLGVYVNGVKVFGVRRDTNSGNKVETLSHGLVYLLVGGDTLQVYAAEGTAFFSQRSGGQTSFMGFLLYK